MRDEVLYRFRGTGYPRTLHIEGRVGGQVVSRQDFTITIRPDSCADRFFVARFNAANEDPSGDIDLVAIREDALEALKEEISDLQACGAGVTQAGVTALLLFEGALRVAAYNTSCEENSYNATESGCDADPEALYSYQFGLGALHTSNLHPCKGGAWTAGMRASFLSLLAEHGFAADASVLTPTERERFAAVCPSATPSAVDHYLLAAHDTYGIPRNGRGNHLAGSGEFPLFEPRVSMGLSFRALHGNCESIGSDRDAIEVYGGADGAYATTARQDQILSLFEVFAEAECP